MKILIVKAIIYPIIIGIATMIIYIIFSRKKHLILLQKSNNQKKEKTKYILRALSVLIISYMLFSGAYLLMGNKYYDRYNNIYFSFTDVLLYDENNNSYKLVEEQGDYFYVNEDDNIKIVWNEAFITPGGYLVFGDRNSFDYIDSQTYKDINGNIYHQPYWPYWDRNGMLFLDCGDKTYVYSNDEQNKFCKSNNIDLPDIINRKKINTRTSK